MDDLDMQGEPESDAPKPQAMKRPAAAQQGGAARRARPDLAALARHTGALARPEAGLDKAPLPGALARRGPAANPKVQKSSEATKNHRRGAEKAFGFRELDQWGQAMNGVPEPPVWPSQFRPPLKVGSDCAGLVTEGLALEMLRVDHQHLFITEKNRDVRHLAYGIYGRTPSYFKDVMARDVKKLPRVDLYVFGFPCQSFSPAGKGKGMADKRAHVLFHCMDYVRCHRPPIVVAENSARLASAKSRAQGLEGGGCSASYRGDVSSSCRVVAFGRRWYRCPSPGSWTPGRS